MSVSQLDASRQHDRSGMFHILLVLLVTTVFISSTAAHRAVHGRKISKHIVTRNDSRAQRNLALFDLVDANPSFVLSYFLLCITVIVLSLKRRYPHWAVCAGTLSLLIPGLMYGIFCMVLFTKLGSL